MIGERAGERREGGGAAEHGGRHLAEPVRELDLSEEAWSLREEDAWRREGHSARTLVKTESLRIVLIDLNVGARLGEHRAVSRMSIQVLTGRIRVELPGDQRELEAGHLLAIDEQIPHDVEALEPSTILLTLAVTEGEPLPSH
jgi:quercetin dioxygenase-like cupin family protein